MPNNDNRRTFRSDKLEDDRQCAVIAARVLQFYKLPEQEMSLETGLVLHGMVLRCIGEINNAGTLEERFDAMMVDLDWQRWLSSRHENGRLRAKHFRIFERYLGVLEAFDAIQETRQ
jgi:hypothetical protein